MKAGSRGISIAQGQQCKTSKSERRRARGEPAPTAAATSIMAMTTAKAVPPPAQYNPVSANYCI